MFISCPVDSLGMETPQPLDTLRQKVTHIRHQLNQVDEMISSLADLLPTQKQIKCLRRFGFLEADIHQLTRRQAWAIINQKVAQFNTQRVEEDYARSLDADDLPQGIPEAWKL